MKLFDYFMINPLEKEGLKISVQSRNLAQFFKDAKTPIDQPVYNKTRFRVDLISMFDKPDLRALRKSLDPVRPTHSYSTNYQEFSRDSIPNLSFLTDVEIEFGLDVLIPKPILRTEYRDYIKSVEFYSSFLRKQIEYFYETRVENPLVIDGLNLEFVNGSEPITTRTFTELETMNLPSEVIETLRFNPRTRLYEVVPQ